MKDSQPIKELGKTLNVQLRKVDEYSKRLYFPYFVLDQDGQVEGLSLINCGIKNLKVMFEQLKEFPKLKTLDLRSNQFQDIEALIVLPNLKSLYLGGNQLEDIAPIRDLTQLTSLGLSRTCLSEIDTTPADWLDQSERLIFKRKPIK